MNSEYILIAGGALMFAGFGIALIRTAAGLKKQAREKDTKCTAQATGRVIRNEKSVTTRNSNNDRRRITAYHPVVRFTDNMGKTQERTHKVGTNPPSYEEGEVVMVSYDPKHPGRSSCQRITMDRPCCRNSSYCLAPYVSLQQLHSRP